MTTGKLDAHFHTAFIEGPLPLAEIRGLRSTHFTHLCKCTALRVAYNRDADLSRLHVFLFDIKITFLSTNSEDDKPLCHHPIFDFQVGDH